MTSRPCRVARRTPACARRPWAGRSRRRGRPVRSAPPAIRRSSSHRARSQRRAPRLDLAEQQRVRPEAGGRGAEGRQGEQRQRGRGHAEVVARRRGVVHAGLLSRAVRSGTDRRGRPTTLRQRRGPTWHPQSSARHIGGMLEARDDETSRDGLDRLGLRVPEECGGRGTTPLTLWDTLSAARTPCSTP